MEYHKRVTPLCLLRYIQLWYLDNVNRISMFFYDCQQVGNRKPDCYGVLVGMHSDQIRELIVQIESDCRRFIIKKAQRRNRSRTQFQYRH